jgi:hypothetical protein
MVWRAESDKTDDIKERGVQLALAGQLTVVVDGMGRYEKRS